MNPNSPAAIGHVKPLAQPAQGADFASLIAEALAQARETGRAAEINSAKAIMGEVSLHEVVASVANAEVTLQTVVAVRDRVIGAYNDIMRMPI